MAQKIAVIGFRITSVYLFYSATMPFMSTLPFVQNANITAAALISGLSGSAFILVLCVFVWHYAPILPEKLLWLDRQESGKQPIVPLLFRIIGLFLFFKEIPRLTWYVTSLVSRTYDVGFFLDPYSMPATVGAFAGILTWRFAGVLAKLFTKGVEDSESGPSISWDDSDL